MKGIDIGRLCGVGLTGGVEMVSGLSVDILEVQCMYVGAWVNDNFQVGNETL